MKIGIDLGHGVNPDRGAVGNIAEEEIINAVGTLVISKLKALGHSVVELRPASASSVQDSLQQRYNKADYFNVDMCVSIHANAGGGIGTEVFTYNAKEVPQARAVLNNMVSLGFRNRGIKDGSNLAMVRKPRASAMLIEICFVDSSDSSLYTSIGAEVISTEIVEGLTGQIINSVTGNWIYSKDKSKWWYKHSDGTYTKDGWEKINGKWYLFDNDGWMLYDWKYDNGNWYYLGEANDGSMKTGWILQNNNWYYFNDSGVMCTGWLKYKNDWYFLQSNGVMATGWVQDNNNWYLMDSNGIMYSDITAYGYSFAKNGVATKLKS